MGSLEWVRSQILVRVSTRLETLLNERLFQVAYKQSLYTGGQGASSSTGWLDFVKAIYDRKWPVCIFWCPVDASLYRCHVCFSSWYGWMAVGTSIILIIIAIIQEKSTSKLLGEANSLDVIGRGLVNKNLRNAEIIESMACCRIFRALAWRHPTSPVLTSKSKLSRRFNQRAVKNYQAIIAILGTGTGRLFSDRTRNTPD